ncbi:MAG: sensor histidine kinase [Solirubrobacteraceae bacterium]
MRRGRPLRGALGLRGRIVGAVLITTVATLAIAAVALLGPLEHSLRQSALTTLEKDLGKHPTKHFAAIDLTDLRPRKTRIALDTAQRQLGTSAGGTAVVLGYPDSAGRGELLLNLSDEGEVAESDTLNDVASAFRTQRDQRGFGTNGDTEYARLALFFRNNGQPFVLAVRRPIDEIPAAVEAVRRAFMTAALAGLALMLILAIPLAARIVRRLRRLREAALELAREGYGAEVPIDRARDEVGDLARTFAILQRRLRHQEEARRAFVATASHELRTPLTSLEGMLELLDDDLRSDTPDLDDARDLLERARSQSRRLGRLAADLLDLSRIDAEVKLRSEPVELGELSRAVLAEFELGTQERGLRISLDDRGGPVWALGDPGSVARIVRILLDNAVRVSSRDTEVSVRLSGGAQPALTVRDHGPGVAEDERELIFERFQRGRETGGQAGFGLGLAIGRQLAERMGGELMLEPTDGRGATFLLRLPGARQPEEEPVAVA